MTADRVYLHNLRDPSGVVHRAGKVPHTTLCGRDFRKTKGASPEATSAPSGCWSCNGARCACRKPFPSLTRRNDGMFGCRICGLPIRP